MEIRWSLPAAEDLQRIRETIERDNPEAARRVARTIYEGCATLKDFPNRGRVSIRMAGRRELLFPPLPYIVVYQITEESVDIPASFTVRRIGPKPSRLNIGDDSPEGATPLTRTNIVIA